MSEALDTAEARAAALVRLGVALHRRRRLRAALARYNEALALQPDQADALSNRGACLRELGDLEGALASQDAAINAHPDHFAAHLNRAATLLDLGRLAPAIGSARRAAALNPGEPRAKVLIAKARLLAGDWAAGLPLWRRWRPRGPLALPPERHLRRAQDAVGKSVLLYGELGLGDTILFSRYALTLQALGAKVTLAPQTPLLRLMQGLSPPVSIAAEPPAAIAERFDWICALPDLPAAFAATPDAIPAFDAYLRAEPRRVKAWSDRLGRDGFKIGVCWQGGLGPDDLGRSFPLAALAGISRLPGVRLISLQQGEGLAQLAALPTGMTVETLGAFDAPPDAFLDTAAVMQACDLVINSDTSVAHLAGALGVPAWIALKYAPAFIWLRGRPDSPWYPSVRLFRQHRPGDWDSVFAAMQAQLAARLSAGAP